jgi:hypothetical protein
VTEKNYVRKIFEPKRQEVRDGGENLTSNFPFLPDITVVVKLRRMKLVEHVARMGEIYTQRNFIPIFRSDKTVFET